MGKKTTIFEKGEFFLLIYSSVSGARVDLLIAIVLLPLGDGRVQADFLADLSLLL